MTIANAPVGQAPLSIGAATAATGPQRPPAKRQLTAVADRRPAPEPR